MSQEGFGLLPVLGEAVRPQAGDGLPAGGQPAGRLMLDQIQQLLHQPHHHDKDWMRYVIFSMAGQEARAFQPCEAELQMVRLVLGAQRLRQAQIVPDQGEIAAQPCGGFDDFPEPLS
jgi:hypothetical protein